MSLVNRRQTLVWRRFTSDLAFCLSWGAISWKSKKHSIVTTSRAEAEYKAFEIAAQECEWHGRVYVSATNGLQAVLQINVDNQGLIKMAKNITSGN